MTSYEIIVDEMTSLFDEEQARQLSRFFKTGQGEYGEGDRFLGIKVPITRSIVKKYITEVSLEEIDKLISSEWHEIRLAGFLLLLELYKLKIKSREYKSAGSLVKFYLSRIDKSNNWDLVDLVSEYILGDWIMKNPEDEYILFELAAKQGYLWHQRVSIVSTFTLIKAGKFDLTFKIAELFLDHPHDLIHKATGWMLRETGKRGGKEKLVEFLNMYKFRMPRTMLRYAIERFPEEERKFFLNKS